MNVLSSKSGSEPFSFALFFGDLRWNDPNQYLLGSKDAVRNANHV